MGESKLLHILLPIQLRCLTFSYCAFIYSVYTDFFVIALIEKIYSVKQLPAWLGKVVV